MLKKAALFYFMVFVGLSSAIAQNNDTVYFVNGDRITGEVKKFEYGLLTFKTDAMQTVTIEYDRINTVFSNKFFEIRTSAGYRYYGSLMPSQIPSTINIVVTNDTIPKPIIDIVEITSIKHSFFKKLDGSVDLGLSYTKASDVFQYNLAASVEYRSLKNYSKFSLSSIFTDQSNADISRNNNIGLNVNRVLPGSWFAGVMVKGQQNTQLDLHSRWQVGLGSGYDLIHTNSNRLFIISGLFVNREITIDSGFISTNFEGLIALDYKWFRYRHPKIDVSSGFDFYPSFTVAGRVRMEYNLSAKFEIVKDLYFNLTLYDNFDTKPSGGTTSKNDWGTTTSLSYSF